MTKHPHCELIQKHAQRLRYENGNLIWEDSHSPHTKNGTVAGSKDTHGYIQIHIYGVSVLAHRIIWFMFYGNFPEQIDHINRNRSDNRIENLRASNNTRNQHNASLRKDNSSGCPGVNLKDGKWCARIAANKKRIALGYFNTKTEAIAAYQSAKEILHAQ